jgi:hypothetical protein
LTSEELVLACVVLPSWLVKLDDLISEHDEREDVLLGTRVGHVDEIPLVEEQVAVDDFLDVVDGAASVEIGVGVG